MATVQMKSDYAASEVYSTAGSEAPPVIIFYCKTRKKKQKFVALRCTFTKLFKCCSVMIHLEIFFSLKQTKRRLLFNSFISNQRTYNFQLNDLMI